MKLHIDELVETLPDLTELFYILQLTNMTIVNFLETIKIELAPLSK